jgi:ribose transport system substrate-binding protein
MASREVVSGLLIAAGLVACGPGAATGSAPAERELRIAVIPKGTTHEFWKSIHAGARRAARELGGIEVIWRGPEREDDRDQQVSLVQNFVSQGVDAIVIAPLDQRALLAPVKLATARGIPVVVVDSGLDGVVGQDFVSYVATDNHLGGELAARHLAGVLGEQGRVLMLRYQEGSESTRQREQGFLDEMARHPGVAVVDPERYAGASRSSAQEAGENLLAVHAAVDGVFCSNESATFGMLLALRSRDLAGKKRFMGFDASQELVDALERGEIDGLVVQNPVKMGDLGVRTALDAIRGRPVAQRIDTGVVVVTRENRSEPSIDALLHPDLGE